VRLVSFETVVKSPIAHHAANNDEPPYETKSKGTPVTGMMPRFIPMF
jgi:hypothetical protein